MNKVQRLNEYSLKGDVLLKRLKHYRDVSTHLSLLLVNIKFNLEYKYYNNINQYIHVKSLVYLDRVY